jgi:putative ABC transport system permease protein
MKRSLRSWLWRVPIEQEVEEELAFHIEMRRREGKALNADDIDRARRACLAIARKRDRDMRLTQWLGDVNQDVRLAIRQMRTSPGFAFVATVTLALGIGANSAIFALADATLLRPLPFREPDRLLAVVERSATTPRLPVSTPTFEDIRNQSRSFDYLEAIQTGIGGGPLVTAPDGSVDTVERQSVTAGFFGALGVTPVAGRTFRPSDAVASVIFSESLWRGRFNADVSLIGRAVKLNGVPFTLVGVVPDNAQLARPARMWTLMRMQDVPEFVRRRPFKVLEVVGRLKPGVTVDAARADLAAIGARIARDNSDTGKGFAIDAEPLGTWLTGPDLQRTSMLLLAVVGFVLLMCCANVANLLLARTSARARELAIRTALGAGRARVVAQMLTESVVLALVGGTLGVAVGAAILRAAPAVIPPGLLAPAVILEFNARVAAFGFAAAILVGLVFGLAPAWHATSRSLLPALATESRTSTGGSRFRSVVVSGEVAAAVLLLCGAGLLLRTLLVLVNVDTGYRVDSSRVLTLDFSLDFGRPNSPRPTPESLLQFYADVARELEERPEVESVGWSSSLPYGTTEFGPFSIEVVGDAPVAADRRPRADVAVAEDGYFRTLDLPIVAGRRFTDRDSAAAPSVCIVNEAFVRRVLRGRNPLGVRIRLQRTPQEQPIVKEIVGVARQTSGGTTDRNEFMQVYMPLAQFAWGDVYMVARASRGPAEALTPLVRSIVARHDPNTPVRRDRTLEYLSVQSTAGYRFRAALVGTFAALALALAMIGVFGVLAYSVQQRQREFGVRVALGASSPSILWLVLGNAGRLISVGGIIGLVLALALGRSISAFLFGVPPVDPVTFAGVGLLVLLTAAAAAAAPAWRAARVDPVLMFRAD